MAICTPNLDPGDAVSNDVIGMHQAFTDNGFEVRVFAQNAEITRSKVYKPETRQRVYQEFPGYTDLSPFSRMERRH